MPKAEVDGTLLEQRFRAFEQVVLQQQMEGKEVQGQGLKTGFGKLS